MYAQSFHYVELSSEYEMTSKHETNNPQEMYLFIHNAFTIYNCSYIALTLDDDTDHTIFNPDEASILLLKDEVVSCQSCKYYTPCQNCKELNCFSFDKNGACCMPDVYELGGSLSTSWEAKVLREGCSNWKKNK